MIRFFLLFAAFPFLLWDGCLASEWLNYTCGKHISSIIGHGDSIWAGTWGGLAVINRETEDVSLFNKTNSNLLDNAVTKLSVDSNGIIYIGSRWLQKFDKNVWETYPSISVGHTDWIYCIASDKNDNLYVGDGLCLKKFNGATWDSVQLESRFAAFFVINSIVFDLQGNVLIGSYKGLYIIKNMTISKHIYNPGIGEITSILTDTNESIWIGTTQNGLQKLDINTGEILETADSSITGGYINCMCYDSQKNLWLGTFRGLIKFDGKNWTVYDTDNSLLPENEIASIYVDEFNIKWVSTWNNGLFKFDGANWKRYTTGNSELNDNWLHSIAVDKRRTVWICDGKDIIRFDGRQWTKNDSSSAGYFDSLFTRIFEDSAKIIWAGADVALVLTKNVGSSFYVDNIGKLNKSGNIKRDKNGIIWMARNDGLGRYDGSQWKVYDKTNSPMPGDDVGQIMISDNNQVWFTSNNGASLTLVDSLQWKTVYTCASGYWITSISLDKKGDPWIGVGYASTVGEEYGKGVLHYDGQKWDSFTISNTDLPSNWVTELEFDTTGNLWIGAYGGMAKFDGKSLWTAYTMKNSGLPDDNVETIEIDDAGNKWIQTQYGGLAVFREGGVVLEAINENYCEYIFKHKKESFSIKLDGNILYLKSTDFIGKGSLTIAVFNISGRLIYRLNTIRNFVPNKTNGFTLPRISTGVYFLNAQFNNENIKTKIYYTDK